MLYDPKWEVKADPLSLESFIAWLEKQPKNGTYEFCRWDGCVIAQWLRASFEDFFLCEGGHSYMYHVAGKDRDFGHLSEVANGLVCTYGEALHRARAQLAAR